MPVWVDIVHVATGERRTMPSVLERDPYGDWDTSYWRVGNGQCDCNRELCFMRVAGAEDHEAVRCSDGRFWVTIREAATDRVIYREPEEA